MDVQTDTAKITYTSMQLLVVNALKVEGNKKERMSKKGTRRMYDLLHIVPVA